MTRLKAIAIAGIATLIFGALAIGITANAQSRSNDTTVDALTSDLNIANATPDASRLDPTGPAQSPVGLNTGTGDIQSSEYADHDDDHGDTDHDDDGDSHRGRDHEEDD